MIDISAPLAERAPNDGLVVQLLSDSYKFLGSFLKLKGEREQAKEYGRKAKEVLRTSH